MQQQQHDRSGEILNSTHNSQFVDSNFLENVFNGINEDEDEDKCWSRFAKKDLMAFLERNKLKELQWLLQTFNSVD